MRKLLILILALSLIACNPRIEPGIYDVYLLDGYLGQYDETKLKFDGGDFCILQPNDVWACFDKDIMRIELAD